MNKLEIDLNLKVGERTFENDAMIAIKSNNLKNNP